MSSWASTVEVVTLIVDDLPATKSFYENVFEKTCVYEDESSAVYKFDNIMINLLVAGSADELVSPATVASAHSGVRLQFTLSVDNVDEKCIELERLGVAINNGPMDRPWGIRTASFFDPGGHLWEIAHDLAGPEAQE